MLAFRDGLAIATAIRQGETTAQAIVEAALQDIDDRNSSLNCFTLTTGDRAFRQAQTIDQALQSGQSVGPLCGVPFAVKNLFDIAGEVTLAGSLINRDNPPASQDATAITRLEEAGAILVGALNMDEYAYGFVTVNSHYGATPNPHDPQRVAGGSSGGSAAAVSANLVPLTLGSDTNGSIRVPAGLCGVYGLKPTYGRLSRAGAFLFAASLDHIGPLARSVRDIAASFDAMQGTDARDPVCTERQPALTLPELEQGIESLRIAIAGDYFERGMEPAVESALTKVKTALDITQTATLPEAAKARTAAYLMTASEGSQLHLQRLQTRLMDFDPETRDRFLAGAMIPASWYLQAQRFRRWFQTQVKSIFDQVDVLIAPTTPCVAPFIDQKTMDIAGQSILVRPHLGLYTQPLSFIGLPVLSAPVAEPGALPVGVQIIAAPYQEAVILKVARWLEKHHVIAPFHV
ncbi:AtzE family amidohydrolase [Oscillatoria sp. CS-180]|uniref:AtzE family amidohydrolase n=1 Tax=Oscillatoria sp. CS-180 TaxID=3021720 RepID=UPI00232BA7D5|nr:AtzE family amidohydrolase [Oscillatoria sp. CS-180]MDB9525019.1 AtzE family amidohydrolase [Oscillatoria sp. CS-180]